MKYFLVLLVAIAPCTHGAECADSDGRCKKTSQLVKVLGYEESVKAFQDSCLEQSKTFSPDVLVRKDPKLFWDITPDSPKWPKVVKAYEAYKLDYCGDAMTPLLLDAYREAWAKNLTDEDLDSALAYLRSPRGRGFAKALPNIYKTVPRLVLPAFNELGQRAYLRYAKRLRAIADE
jgi:hypothetical protein